jgi:SPP1 family predicted phage head-tail adaptor
MWGEVVPVSGASAVATNYDRRFTHVIRLRYRADVTVVTGMRLVDGERVYNIRFVTNKEERSRWVDILAEEGGVL